MKRPTAPQLAVGCLIVAYIAVFGTLSLRRHQNLRTNALDLGYTDQAVWNTLQGRAFRFSTYLDAAFPLDIAIQDFRQPDILLGYHVEPILAAISLLYAFHNGPETLLWLQTFAIALGAIPLYQIVCHRIGLCGERLECGDSPAVPSLERIAGPWLPVAFVLIYLLSPALQAANMSDFHTVALSPVLLLSAFYFLETDRPWGFVLFAFLAAMCKEEISLLVAMMGLWAAFVRRRWWLGLGTFLAAIVWFLLCVQVIMPHYSGLRSSAFLVRYGHLGGSMVGIARNALERPGLFINWMTRPDVVRYLRDLWLSSGGLAILHPLSLIMGLPVIAINALSISGWMRSGGGHYSASVVPFLIVAAAYGADGVAAWLSGRVRTDLRRRTYWILVVTLTTLGLVVALVSHYQRGISPLSRRFALQPISEHARRAQPLIERVNDLPPGVPISVGSNLYPHVGHRDRVYLFPTISDAEVILVDVTGPSSPVGMRHQAAALKEVLDYAQFGAAASDHGFLLLERDLDAYRLSPGFYDAFLAGDAQPSVPLEADFGDELRLVGFDWSVRPVVRPELVVQITTYWRALAPLDDELRLVFFIRNEKGHLVFTHSEERVANWYPTWLWEPKQTIKVTLPPLPLGDQARIGVAVLLPGASEQDIEGRLGPITSPTGGLQTWEQDTVLELPKP